MAQQEANALADKTKQIEESDKNRRAKLMKALAEQKLKVGLLLPLATNNPDFIHSRATWLNSSRALLVRSSPLRPFSSSMLSVSALISRSCVSC